MEPDIKHFIKGFNCGYLLAQYEAQILTKLLRNIQPNNAYMLGVSKGQKEYELWQMKNHFTELSQLRIKNYKEKDKERD